MYYYEINRVYFQNEDCRFCSQNLRNVCASWQSEESLTSFPKFFHNSVSSTIYRHRWSAEWWAFMTHKYPPSWFLQLIFVFFFFEPLLFQWMVNIFCWLPVLSPFNLSGDRALTQNFAGAPIFSDWLKQTEAPFSAEKLKKMISVVLF